MPTTPYRPVVVKLGGSVITRKREVERVRAKVLGRLANELAGYAPSGGLVVLHGAGSFGHPGAVRWGLADAPTVPPKGGARVRGASIVSAEVRRLHVTVLRALVEAGANPWSVPAASVAKNRAGRLVEFDAAPFISALSAGALPVSFGDVVPDLDWGSSILSADTIAVELARRLPAERVVFVSDVEGILSDPGGGGRRSVIPTVTREVVEHLAPRPKAPDVTGGIRGKAEAMLTIASSGAHAGLISGLKGGALSRAIRGEMVYGSWASATSH
ncbi:MAG: isopentenyl phosphate kinase family protein [Thermoplasmata archaeon]|nr:isopentenyl phosphate kinase family protein [Thermoplasmata archaeon]